MARTVLLQLVIALVVTLVAALLGGERAAISSFLGGMCSVLPNVLFAIGLFYSERKERNRTLGSLMLWEVVKVVTTVASLVVVFWLYKDVNWVALFVSFVIALKSYIFLLYLLSRLKI